MEIAFGSGALLGATSERQSLRLLHTALDEGIVRFDTARLYGRGEVEALLGRVVGDRSDVFVTTKVGQGEATRLPGARILYGAASGLVRARRRLRRNRSGAVTPATANARVDRRVDFEETHIRQSIDLSRRLLRREVLDRVLLHEIDERDSTAQVAEVMDSLVSCGVIRSWGLATRRLELSAVRKHSRYASVWAQTGGGPLLASSSEDSVLRVGGIHSLFGPSGAGLRSFARWVALLEDGRVRDSGLDLSSMGMAGLADVVAGHAASTSPGAEFVVSSGNDKRLREVIASLRRGVTHGPRVSVLELFARYRAETAYGRK